jgi:Ser/Thr protein kinase RdoA (MazF antagonist)
VEWLAQDHEAAERILTELKDKDPQKADMAARWIAGYEEEKRLAAEEAAEARALTPTAADSLPLTPAAGPARPLTPGVGLFNNPRP